jgi:hypothetical protein
MNIAELLTDDLLAAQQAVTAAERGVTEAEIAATRARNAAAADPQDAALAAAAQETETELAERRAELSTVKDMLAARRDIHRRTWEQQGAQSADFFRFLDYISPNFLPFLIGCVLVAAMYWIMSQASTAGPEEASHSRSTITVIFGGTTIAVALIITLVAMLRADVNNDERFRISKEVFTALLGIFGTILGFYFSQSIKSESNPPVVEKIGDEEKTLPAKTGDKANAAAGPSPVETIGAPP